MQSNIDITEIDSEDIFDNLNEKYPDTPKTMEIDTIIQNTPEPEIEPEPEIQKPFISSINLQSSTRVNNYVSPDKLNTLKILNSYDEIKTKTQNTQSRQQQINVLVE